MYTIKVQNECECFKKSELTNNSTLPSATSAVMQAMKILNQTKAVTNCCGNGCCG